MCHWTLRVVSFDERLNVQIADANQWECGDSFFTKYSSCSFDRAVHPNNPLNPLHPSITPSIEDSSRWNNTGVPAVGPSRTIENVQETIMFVHSDPPTMRKQSRGQEVHFTRAAAASLDDGTPKDNHRDPGTNGVRVCPEYGKKREPISTMPLSEVGKASRSSPRVLAESKKCQVFEVVLQQHETTICPSCARSPRRAALPAHARGCFGLS